VAIHRFGPEDTEWHISQPATDGHRTDSPVATATWMRSVSRYLGTRPPELLMIPVCYYGGLRRSEVGTAMTIAVYGDPWPSTAAAAIVSAFARACQGPPHT
jgi:hypothetical protein